jgi:hypothetical protein
MRRAAQVLFWKACRIRQPKRILRGLRAVVMEPRPVDRIDSLALRLWKLGEQQEALAVHRDNRGLAPATRTASAAGWQRAWRAWLASHPGQDSRTWHSRNDHRSRPAQMQLRTEYLPRSSLRIIAQRLVWLSDCLDTMTFWRQSANRERDPQQLPLDLH